MFVSFYQDCPKTLRTAFVHIQNIAYFNKKIKLAYNLCDFGKLTDKCPIIPCSSVGTERITVPLTKTGEKRVWAKKLSCIYCCELQSNLRRHLFRKHANEHEVLKVMSFAKNSEARKKGLEKLQNLGDFYHNARVIEKREGEFLVFKRPSNDKKVFYKEYVPCVFCKCYILGVEIWRHYKVCKFKSEDLTVDNEECQTYLSTENLRDSRILAESA